MKHKVFFGIAIRIIILFSIGFLGSFIPDNCRELLGDSPCPIDIETGSFDCDDISASPFSVDPGWNWGTQHYWYYWMMFILFLLSLINVIWQSHNLFKKYHPEILK